MLMSVNSVKESEGFVDSKRICVGFWTSGLLVLGFAFSCQISSLLQSSPNLNSCQH